VMLAIFSVTITTVLIFRHGTQPFQFSHCLYSAC
jgi:hypothetical protein